MRVGLLMCGSLSEEMRVHYPDGFTPLFKKSLLNADPSLDFGVYNVFEDDFPDSPHACDGWVISGSRSGVYENLPWMLTLQGFIREVYDARVPLVGICFGHQIMAQALGGHVIKVPQGWGMGLSRYKRLGILEQSHKTDLALYSVHQDQVIERPDEATVIATNAHCENAAFLYEKEALSFQPHPEFSEKFERDLIAYMRKDPSRLTPEQADQALQSIDSGNVDNSEIMQLIVRFLKQGHKGL